MSMETAALERTLIYDADCGFCTRSAKWLARNGKVRIEAWQGIQNLEHLRLTEEMANSAAFWVDGGQVIARGEAAIAQALITRAGVWKPAGLFILAVRPLAAVVYSYIAKNRHVMPGGTNACRLPRR